MNLHQVVRGAITSVNPDIPAQFLASTGYTINSAGKQTPAYATPVTVTIQVQPLSSQELAHINFLNMQGVFRAIYLYGDAEGIVRLQQKGGDLFQFAAFAGDPVANWLTVKAEENWNVNSGGWTRAIVQLQTDVLT
jgi:hypothetical protein